MNKSLAHRAVLCATVAALLATTACQGSAPGEKDGSGSGSKGPITFVGAKDRTGTVGRIVDGWNADHPDEKVTFVEYSSAESDTARGQLVQNFQARSDRFDVITTNNVWVSEFAARKWIRPLAEDAFPLDGMVAAPLATGKYQGKLYAVPWYTDAGLLYYRKDLVRKPPRTFAELKSMCAVAERERMDCYAGQYAQYDGLTVNVQEAIVAAGGAVLDDDGQPTVDTDEARAGLQLLADGFEQGWIPKKAITYHEEEVRQSFQRGRLLFMRNWPYAYQLGNQKDSAVAGKFGVAPLPGIDGPGRSALGGWNLSVSAFSAHPETASSFIAYLAGEAQQRALIEGMSLSPVHADLYEDASLTKKYPYLPALKASLENAVPLPKSPAWSAMSLAIQKNCYPVLQGKRAAGDATVGMQKDLVEAVEDE